MNRFSTGVAASLLALVVIMPTLARCEEDERAPAAAKPEPENKPDERKQIAGRAVHAGRSFVSALCKSDAAGAYQLTTAEFRMRHTPEAFAEQMKDLRIAARLESLPPLDGWAVVKPKEGEPRRARLVGYFFFVTMMRGSKPPATVGLELVEQEGKWLVDDVRELSLAGEAREFKTSYRTAAGRNIDTVAEATSTLRGVVTEVKDDSVTLRVDLRTRDDRTEDRTFRVDDKTQVISMPTKMFPGNNGQRVAVPGPVRTGNLADLKVDDSVVFEPSFEDPKYVVLFQVIGQQPGQKRDAGGPGL